MLGALKELYSLLTREQRRRFFRLQILVILVAFAEIVGVASVGPFMSLVSDRRQLDGDGPLATLYHAGPFTSPETFLYALGVGSFLLLLVSGVFSMYTLWRLCLFGAYVGADLSSRIYQFHMQQPWLFHAENPSSKLAHQISQECRRVADQIINPLMRMNGKLVMAVMMLIALLIYNIQVALFALVLFGGCYLLLYCSVRRLLIRNGRMISVAQEHRFKLMSEGFGGIKDVLLLGRQSSFTNSFRRASRDMAHSGGTSAALAQTARYAMEIVAYGTVIMLVLYLLAAHDGEAGGILPNISIYALAGLKLMPAFQQVYVGISCIRGNLSAFETIRDDLRASAGFPGVESEDDGPASNERLVLRRDVQLQDVTFAYSNKGEAALDGVTLTVPVNKVVGLVGASGSGKSTAIDILLGLVTPQRGEVLIDGVPLDDGNRRRWQNLIGLVPQSIFLADGSIRDNVAFGLEDADIDDARVRRAVTMAHLDELIAGLPQGLETRVGERGVQLSGGQRQRIGIARALYHDADMLVLDEATSAMDGITEQLIMDAIHDFAGTKTIVMVAHRLATVRQCDVIYLMEAGRVIDQGSYDDLVGRNALFRRMARQA
ncbi:ABC transporter ATP-binding protein [Modicisalibacter tunisiensis]|nr:ABC transporter ATP-binding protein [Modicisalibacter tunisiensis]